MADEAFTVRIPARGYAAAGRNGPGQAARQEASLTMQMIRMLKSAGAAGYSHEGGRR
jgi:hypothetical protein